MQKPQIPTARFRPFHRFSNRCPGAVTRSYWLKRLCLLITLGCLVPAPSALAKIYKWVDAAGNVHYTDEEPPDSAARSEQITIAVEEPPATPDEGEVRRREYLKSAAELPDRRAEAAAQVQQQNTASAAQLCQQARVHGEVLKLGMRVYRSDRGELRPHWFPDSYQGERTYIGDTERPAVIDRNEAQLRANCSDPNDVGARLRAYNRWLVSDWCDSSSADLNEALEERARSTGDKLDKLRREVAYWCGPGAG